MVAGDPEPTDSFELLAHPTRMAVLRELFESLRATPDDPAVQFSELRKRVDAPDSGNFSYHLDRLVGWYVEETDSGYRLSDRGYSVALALKSGRYGRDETPGPVESFGECLFCETPVELRIEDGHSELRCSNGHRSYVFVRPAAIETRSREELRELVALRLYANVQQTLRGVCRACDAAVEMTGEYNDDVDGYLFVDRCSGCGAQLALTAGLCALQDLDVARFLRDRGADPRTTPHWEFECCRAGAETVVSEEPLELRIAVERDGDRLSATLDESGEVVRVSHHR